MRKKVIGIITAVLLIIGIATGVHFFFSNGSVPASATIENGLSAYELAVQYGYEGTIQEWLDSLNGKSAYEIAKENGYSGTEEEWLLSLEATEQKSAVGIKTASFSSKGELLITLTDGTVLNVGQAVGKNGADGKDGIDGNDGVDGSDGKDGTDGKDGKDGKDGSIFIG